jgi:energy-coupling factor transport system substrate-specific component
MKAAISMWRYPRMILLAALSAALYAILLASFKQTVPLIPWITEIRIASIVPIVLGLLFGPAGAWGAAAGNLAGDLFGTFTLSSFFGFFGNFLLAFIPYAMWGRLGLFIRGGDPAMRSIGQWIEYVAITTVASISCATVIAWGVMLLGAAPFAVLGPIIALNDTLAGWIGGLLLLATYGAAKRMGLRWQDVMSPEDVGKPSNPTLGTTLLVAGGVGGWILGVYLLPASLAVPVLIPFVLAILVGAAML